MFGFLKRRVRFEHFKLITQTRRAAEASLFAAQEKRDSDEALYFENMLSEIFESAKRRVDGVMPNSDVDRILEINRELRRRHDEDGMGVFKSFDEFYEPNSGWKRFYKMSSEYK